ncbi:MAG: Hsp20/alpha crystallin family protein [Desulfarculaceae bacterium]|jgi:HSP20 family protein
MFELVPSVGFSSLGKLRKDMDNLWSRFFDGGELSLPRADQGLFAPAVDVKETDKAIEFRAEIPGLKSEEIEVTLTGDVLTIKGEKKSEHEEEDGDYHLVERRFGSFQRSFRLPMEVNRKELKASHKDGVLTVSLPKKEKEGSTKVQVEAAH